MFSAAEGETAPGYGVVIFSAETGHTRFMEVNSMQQTSKAKAGGSVPAAYESRCLHELGGAVYVVERVFTGRRTLRQAVVEEIITAAGAAGSFDRPAGPVV